MTFAARSQDETRRGYNEPRAAKLCGCRDSSIGDAKGDPLAPTRVLRSGRADDAVKMIRMAISAEAYEAVINAPKRPPCIVTYETTPDGEYVIGMVEEIWLNKLRTLGEKDYSVGIERLVASWQAMPRDQ